MKIKRNFSIREVGMPILKDFLEPKLMLLGRVNNPVAISMLVFATNKL
jgi:hypothetical protein